MHDNIILSTEDLSAGYGGKPVLQGVDMTIHEGEIVAVIGRNGVGKSTLMKSLIGLLPADRGSINFKGHNIVSMKAHQRARQGMGYVPQGRDVFPRMSVEENLLVGNSISGKTENLENIYEYFPILAERRRQRAGTMSGGQQQQLAIGRILVADPSLILLDEPSEGIQPSIVQEIAQLLIKINGTTGLTVLFVEQNIDMIRAMAQRCYVMDKGRITAELTGEMLKDGDLIRRHLSV
ncbi:ABC transporter ATP-binding protein [Agrobacterium tumefaciens]|uniref:ABC transporter ATP-binding protein n=1 Tax=Agrobacterium tumefaciens TaxID=358 RepID=UPI001573532A|nr:ABC transporter ATP-binding protein [Agrobacterium tumefaciens]NTB97351.1 ABC transporter ATP-binding protein [Agrobacterium tumefaciens]NTC45087.1 ABC transporter ATP-binding protein [Agrobacterium tumefaciens]